MKALEKEFLNNGGDEKSRKAKRSSAMEEDFDIDMIDKELDGSKK
jgi:hypothetical protein